MKKAVINTIGIIIIAAIVIGIIAVIAVPAGFIMKLFGFEYTSVWSIIWFFVVATIVSYPIGLFAEAIPKVLLNEFHKVTVWQARFIYVFLDTIATAVGLTVVDGIMESVSATDTAIFVVSLVLALLNIKDIKEKDSE